MNLDLAGNQVVMLPNDASEAEFERLTKDPNWLFQLKADGVHVLASRLSGDRIDTRNRKGEPHACPVAFGNAIHGLPENTIVDGERLHEGGYVVFDLLYLASEDLRECPYAERFDKLRTLHRRAQRDQNAFAWTRVVETAFTAEDKRTLLTRLRIENAEGCIAKDLRAPYRPGRPAEGGPIRRLKFRKSLTCIVLRREAKDLKASFEMYVRDDNGKSVNIGQVSAQQFFTQIEPGKARIAECSYLYSTPGNKLVQPVLVRPVPWRDDKSAEECTLDQLVRGGRFAVK